MNESDIPLHWYFIVKEENLNTAVFKSKFRFDQEVGQWPSSSTKGREVMAGEWRDPNENLISVQSGSISGLMPA